MNNQDQQIYQSLFRRMNLQHRYFNVPYYIQPLVYVALETDPKLRRVLEIMVYVGQEVHKKTFKNSILNILDKNTGEKLISKSMLNTKIRTLELIGCIEVRDYKFRVTTQGLSYIYRKYTKTITTSTVESKLENVTKAKLIAYQSGYGVFFNHKELEKLNIYRFDDDGYLMLTSSSRESISYFIRKIYMIRQHQIEEKESLADEYYSSLNIPYLEMMNIDQIDLKVINFKCKIKIQDSIYIKYKRTFDDLFIMDSYITREYRGRSVLEYNISFEIEPYTI